MGISDTLTILKQGTEELVSMISRVVQEADGKREENGTRSIDFEYEVIIRFAEMVKELDEGVGELNSKSSVTYQNLVLLQRHIRVLKSSLGLQGEMKEVESYNQFLETAVTACESMDKKISLALDLLEETDEKIEADKAKIKLLTENAYMVAQKVYLDPLFGSRFSEDTTSLFSGLLEEVRIENKWRFATDIKYHALELSENISAGQNRSEVLEIAEKMKDVLEMINYYVPE